MYESYIRSKMLRTLFNFNFSLYSSKLEMKVLNLFCKQFFYIQVYSHLYKVPVSLFSFKNIPVDFLLFQNAALTCQLFSHKLDSIKNFKPQLSTIIHNE